MPRSLLLLLALAAPGLAQDGFVHDPPHGLVLDEREPGRIQLVWVPAEDNQRVTVTAYHVWRREGTGPWAQLASTKGDVTFYSDRRVTPGQAYAYRVVSEAVGEGRLLPVEQARRQSEPVGPVLALERWYVSVERVTPTRPDGPDGSAWLRVHRWATETGAWDTSEGFGVRTGGTIGQDGLAGDFRTGATLVAVREAQGDEGPVGFIRYRRDDGEEVEVSTRDAPPGPVWKEAPRTRTRRAPPPETVEGSRERPAARAGEGEATKPLRFPEPTRLETITGTKVLWEIDNQTPYRLSVYYEGPSTGRTLVEPGESVVVRLVRGGDYTVFGRAASTDQVRPVEGKFSMLGGYRYRSTFTVAAAPRGP
ncbi:MAG: fibronectin type III domain-containing protein [Planctomycetes bacterium]|nr:fibronectin type III domain-containing protein [Planctomycetota bacterium]